ncbi:MAG: ATP-binding protein [Chloroflexi bacterium]|nr:ATP-binding protein [Chloroflexota bacterium]MCI0576236.1 ATP-binding protein [Chloroflexota bacterium]MCI0645470.1 ATP-binding protein [Chloroflexota bacterium]MCI0730609.1 ATP-binding protein [Chloroflexota bacterium]
MSIKIRLAFLYTVILMGAFFLFGLSVYLMTRAALVDDVDKGLQTTALEIYDQTTAFVLGDVAVFSVPVNLDTLQPAPTYFVIANARGDVMTHSPVLGEPEALLDPLGLKADNHFSTVIHQGKPLRVLTMPLHIGQGTDGRLVGYLQVARVLESYPVLEDLKLILIFTGFAAVSLSLFLGALTTHRLLKPLDDIAAVAMQINKADDLSRRLPDSGRRDEIGRLTMVLNKTLERLERLFHARQRFLADVSHELRTPLTTIRGNLDLMRRMGEADPEILDVIQEEVERMARLVGDLMLLARADSGGLPIQRQPVELDNLFLDVYRQVRSIEPPVELVLQEVDQVCVLGDADRLKQLILNLVDNAVKYTPAGGTVTLSLSQENGTARVVVADTGIGIPPEDLPRIFDRFYRVDKARSRAHGGSGLGLSIAKWIAQAHGGDIDVTSAIGRGSTFTITLPIYTDRQQRPGANGADNRRTRPVRAVDTTP